MKEIENWGSVVAGRLSQPHSLFIVTVIAFKLTHIFYFTI